MASKMQHQSDLLVNKEITLQISSLVQHILINSLYFLQCLKIT